jgi:hypothetical protein
MVSDPASPDLPTSLLPWWASECFSGPPVNFKPAVYRGGNWGPERLVVYTKFKMKTAC